MTVDQLLREYLDSMIVPVDLDEATTIPLSALATAGHRPRRTLAIAAGGIAAAAITAAAVVAVRRDGTPANPGGVVATTPPAEPTAAPVTTVPTVDAPTETVVETHVAATGAAVGPGEIDPAALAGLALAALESQPDELPPTGGPWAIREWQRRMDSSGRRYSWAYVAGTYGRIFVEAYDVPLDVANDPPFPGSIVALPSGTYAGEASVWPADPFANTAALTGERRTILVRAETLNAEGSVGVFGDPAAYNWGNDARMLLDLAADLDARVNELLGLPPPTVPEPEPPASTALVPIDGLDQPGERTLLTDYQAAIAGGPFTGPTGQTFGDQTGDTITQQGSPDFIAVVHPGDPRQVVVGFVPSATMAIGAGNGSIQIVYGVTGDAVGVVRHITITDANGVEILARHQFEDLAADRTLPLTGNEALAARDADGNGVLDQAELSAPPGGARRVVRGDGTAGHVAAADVDDFLALTEGVADPTSGMVSMVVPFFDLDLAPSGEIDLGAADTVIYDDAGQPIGG